MSTDTESIDAVKTEMMAATAMVRSGDRAGGRSRLEALWARIASNPSNPDPIHECVVAHHLADAQDNFTDELAWDIRALNAAMRCTDADSQRHPNLSIGLFMPSLHTNLAEDYFKLGDFAHSKEHLASARNFIDHLLDDSYGQMIRRGIERIARRLDAIGN